MIKKLSERDHVLLRPSMYIGAVDVTKSREYIQAEGKIQYREIQYVPGLIKIINEIIDNSVDVAIKSGFKQCTQISVKMGATEVQVQDNGTGIPVQKNSDGQYLAELAWGHARAGSNFDDDENRTQMGMNGVGSFVTNCFSRKFTGRTDDGEKSLTLAFKDNAQTFTEKVGPSTKPGVLVKFTPDLERFGIKEIDAAHQQVIQQRLLNLSMSFPEITFKFNNKRVNAGSFKRYIAMFSEHAEIHETPDYRFAILPNPDEDFRQFSYVNGLRIPDGGTHIDLLSGTIVRGVRDKLLRKFKTIKPGDIKNKLQLVVFMKNMRNMKFNSQNKEKITNSLSEVSQYFGKVPWDRIIARVFKNKEIIDPITEVYRIREEFAKRRELKNLGRSPRKIKSEKYYPSIGKKKYLMLCEGKSAIGGLIPVLGRRECGYFELRGKPLNAYSAPQSKFAGNKELSELYKVIQNEGYEYIIFANDADLDGLHIAGLLAGFFHRYFPDLKDRVGRLLTPVKVVSRNDKPTKWVYNIDEDLSPGRGEEFSYMKGLGSWTSGDLKHIVQVDGISKMIDVFEYDSDEILEDWLGSNSEPRKRYILDNTFSIAKV